MNANKIIKACEKAYNKGGVQEAINKAEKMGVTTYEYCKGCEAENPAVDNTCCVCGSTTKSK
jgi:hypothetical protein